MSARPVVALLLVLLAVLSAGESAARDFLIESVAEPNSPFPVLDSGRWMHNEVLPSGEHMMGFVREIQGTGGSFWEVVMADADRTDVAGTAYFDEGSYVSVGLDPIGNQSVFYQDGFSASGHAIAGQVLKSARSYSNSPVWYPESVTVDLGSYGSAQYPAAVGQGDNRWIAYFATGIYGEGSASLYAARPNPGQFETELIDSQITLVRGRGRIAAVDIDGSFDPGIVYMQTDHALIYAERNGSTWTAQVVTNVIGQRVGHVDLVVDGAGTPHVSFYVVDTQDLMYATRDYQGNWSVEPVLTHGRVGKWSSIALDPAGVPHIAAERSTGRAVVLARPAPGGGWSDEVVEDDQDSVGEFCSLAIDSYGGIHIVYRDASNRRAKHAWWIDWNGNGTHDQIEIDAGLLQDCDGNGIVDSAEILRGYAADCDLNGIPDRCEEDCDGDGTLDSCQLAADPSLDCDGNGILDSCDIDAGAPDCDGNGAIDSCEMEADLSLDCDADGNLDSCQVASGDGDCDGDGILDSCQSGFSLDVPGVGHISTGPQEAGTLLAAGDANGDGHPDLFFSQVGEIRVALGGNGLDGVPDFDASTDFGAIAVGDVDGDGLDDLAVGHVEGGWISQESVRVFRSTGSDFDLILDLDPPVSGIDFGEAVALVDVDGDGRKDIIAGAPGSNGSNEGFAYVYLANPLDGTPDQTLSLGSPSPSSFGRVLACAGDVDGNGLEDLMVGSRNSPRYVQVFLSQPGGVMTEGATIQNPGATSRFGLAMAGVGDVNDDGFDDLLVGEPGIPSGANNPGKAWLYLGGAPMDTDADLVFQTPPFGTTIGSAIAGGADLNGDGIDDILIGAESAYIYRRGAVQVYFGGPGLDTIAEVTYYDEEEHGDTGFSVAVLGDMNEDGVTDFAFGAPDEGEDGVVRIRSLDLPAFGDCNGNGITNACDIANGMPDGNFNGIVDFCEGLASAPLPSKSRGARIVSISPTPFNPRTTIDFEVSKAGSVDLSIYDAAGRHVATLFREHASAGSHAVVWNARAGGPALASGVYFAVLRTTESISTQKLVLLK